MDWNKSETELYNKLEPLEKHLFNQISQRFFKEFTRNGWKWNSEENDNDERTYTLTILSDNYECEMTAHVYSHFPHMDWCGELGIHTITLTYEYQDQPLDYMDLQDMLAAIKYTEQHLIKLGIPFCKSYKFHQNKDLIKINNKLLKQWGIPHLEELRIKTYASDDME